MKFSELPLNTELLQAVADAGYTSTTDIQRATIPEILAGHDLMAGAQTGSGKTAAFALPILQRLSSQPFPGDKKPIRALVLTPTRELAQQVHQSFQRYGQHTGLRYALAYGGVSLRPQAEALAEGVDVLVATPGRLLDHLGKGTLSLAALEVLVFDEADRMLDMGFKDEVDRVLKALPTQRQTLLFSATFDDSVFKLSKKLLNEPKLIEVNARNAAAAEVEQIVYTVDADRKRELLSHLIGARNWHQVLIFTRTREQADQLTREMIKDGLPTQAIHGQKSQGARDKALAEFKEGKVRALVATDVAARGIDIVDLQYVINFELPYVAEDYVHRIGRTGRAGKSGIAISLMAPHEEWLLEAVEQVLDTRLMQQWLPGYEPDLTKMDEVETKRRKGSSKQKLRQQALGNKKSGRRRRR